MTALYTANLLFLAVHGAYFFLPVYLTGLGASEAAIGAVMSAMGLSNAGALAWLYRAGERLDTRRLMLAGCAASGASCAGMLVVTGLGGIAALRMLQGIGFCLYFVSANAWTAQCCPPEQRAKQIGYLGIVTLLTQALAPAAAELLAATAGFPSLFALTSVLVAASAVAVTRMPPANPAPAARSGERVLPVGRGKGVALRLGAVAMLSGGGYGAVLLFSPLLLRSRGILPLTLFFTVYAVAAVAARLVGRNWAHRWGNVRLARWCFLLLALATLLVGLSRTPLSFAAASALFGLGHGLMYPAVAAHAVNALPGGSVRALTLWAGGFMIGVSLGAFLAGFVAEHLTVAAAVQWAGVLPLLAWVAMGTGSSGPRQRAA